MAEHSIIELVMQSIRDLRSELGALRAENTTQHRVQGEAIARLDEKLTTSLSRQDEHDDWHGENDEKIARRIGAIEDRDDEAGIRRDERRRWLQRVEKAVTLLAGIGVGSAALKLLEAVL